MTTSETTHEPEMLPDGGQPTPDDDDLAGRMARAEAELKSCQDRLLRALAEQENTRRRAERDRAELVEPAGPGGDLPEDGAPWRAGGRHLEG